MATPTFWDLLDEILPEEEKGATTFVCPDCALEGHFLIVHCRCSFNVTFCIACLQKDRPAAIQVLCDHAAACPDAYAFPAIL